MDETDGKSYIGAWMAGQKHGEGVEINNNTGTKRKGEWKKGKWFRWLSGTETSS